MCFWLSVAAGGNATAAETRAVPHAAAMGGDDVGRIATCRSRSPRTSRNACDVKQLGGLDRHPARHCATSGRELTLSET